MYQRPSIRKGVARDIRRTAGFYGFVHTGHVRAAHTTVDWTAPVGPQERAY